MIFAVQTAKALRGNLRTTDPAAVSKKLGIIYDELPLPKKVKGFAGIMYGNKHIVVNQALPAPWKRVVYFHELGHLKLHRTGHCFYVDESLIPAEHNEVKATIFAAEYLIPNTPHNQQNKKQLSLQLQIPIELFTFKTQQHKLEWDQLG